jgi:hypothetical protein
VHYSGCRARVGEGGRECIPMERVHRKEEMEEVEVKAL